MTIPELLGEEFEGVIPEISEDSPAWLVLWALLEDSKDCGRRVAEVSKLLLNEALNLHFAHLSPGVPSGFTMYSEMLLEKYLKAEPYNSVCKGLNIPEIRAVKIVKRINNIPKDLIKYSKTDSMLHETFLSLKNRYFYCFSDTFRSINSDKNRYLIA